MTKILCAGDIVLRACHLVRDAANRPAPLLVTLFALALSLVADVDRAAAQDGLLPTTGVQAAGEIGKPVEVTLRSAGSTSLDLRDIARQKPRMRVRPERKPPPLNPVELPGGRVLSSLPAGTVPAPSAPAPAPIANFAGLDLSNWGAGWPPDTVGDVGPTHYIQSVNSSVAIYTKSTGVQAAAFSLDSFFSLGSYGNLCDTDNFGDPVILYDSFEDRWVISDFAFQLSGNEVVNPPGAFECIAVSKTGDPVAGGWNFYFLNFTDGLNDYPKLGIWPDGIYMSANMFDFVTSSFQLVRVWALNKEQMYAGDTDIQVVQFDAPASEFTLLPANARLQTGTPPAGTPNYFSTIWQYSNAISFYKFHVDWDRISLSTFTGPFISIAPANWSGPPGTVAVKDGASIDTLGVRLMMQNQYSNIAGVESLWNTHTVQGGVAGRAAPRYYQVDVTSGTVAANTTQAATHAPDTTVDRIMPSLAVNRDGDMAIGYSAVSSTLFPAIRYAGRLSSDTVNTLPQTEAFIIEGTGAQTNTERWGDYSAMSLDPDGCTFWYTNEYYITTGSNWQTRIGSFSLPDCTTVSSGTVQGMVTATDDGAAISAATVSLGSRTTTTNGSGFYQFTSIPSGTYPEIHVTAPGFDSSSVNVVVVGDSSTTIKDFSLDEAAVSACPVDTSQADFQLGIPDNTDLTTSAGDVKLDSSLVVDQQNTSVIGSGFGINSTDWAGQTFTAGVSGLLTEADVYLFCFECTGTTPDLTVSIRATSGNLPTGPDLATGTIGGFATGSGGYFKTTFATPLSITAGTSYAIVLRANSDPSAGTYAYVVSSGNPYPNGRRVTSGDSGSNWSGQAGDLGFHVYVKVGFASDGHLVSSLKDSNPAPDGSPAWSTISWNGTVPADTSLRFQVAAADFESGPFDFVGPDGTAGTYYTSSGASLDQFDGKRYLRYQAQLSTVDPGVTPELHDVTICYQTDVTDTATLTLLKTVENDEGGTAVDTDFTLTATGPEVITGVEGDASITSAVVAVGDYALTESAQAGYTLAGWSCSEGLSGETVTLVKDAVVTCTATNTDDTPVDPADLSISKTDDVTIATPGESVTYTIVVNNVGSVDAVGASVIDNFPLDLSCNWSCVGAGGGSCADSGSGDISDTVDVPVGGSATYTADCTIAVAATGSLVNTATVSFAGDVDSSNDSATDTDTLTDPIFCNVIMVAGTEVSTALREACEILVLGPDYVAASGSSVIASSGWEIEFLPGFTVELGATLDANVCGQSLCMTSETPMPYGCHTCVDQICDGDNHCCNTAFDDVCLDQVETVCNLLCETIPVDTDNDRLADSVETNTGIYIGLSNTGTDPANPDTDGDGIKDGDEVLGTIDGLDLPGMGASPVHKDLLLEYDWFDDNIDCGAHTHRPTAAAIASANAAFANSPVMNPDGITGVNLISDYGQGGVFSGGNLIADADGVIAGGVGGGDFLGYKASNFASNRNGYFRYVLLPHRYNTDSVSSGQAELPGDDLIVSLYCAYSDSNVAHTILHEVGHNLNLRHGGNEECNWKPNYNSVMNYKYQFPGVDNNCTPDGDGILDYSIGERIQLNENNLNEFNGTCGPGFPYDWNGNETIESSVSFDVNSSGNSTCGGTLTILGDYDDWGNIFFGGLTDADGAMLIPVLQEIITEQPVPDEFLNIND
jgi:uncharacterized repeat protein (TIGR01451 family)